MEEHYEQLYERHLQEAEDWLVGYLNNNDFPNKGIVITALLQMGWVTNKGMVERLKEIEQRRSLVLPEAMRKFHTTAVSSRVSTMILKPPTGSILHALIETRPLKSADSHKTKAMEYRLWPPLIKVKTSDLYCLCKNPTFGKGQPYTLTDLKLQVPEVSAHLKHKLPEANERLKKVLDRPMPEPVKPKADDGPLELKTPETPETVPEDTEDTERVSASSLIESADVAQPMVVSDGFKKPMEYLSTLLPDQRVNPAAGRAQVDINLNVNFSIGKPR